MQRKPRRLELPLETRHLPSGGTELGLGADQLVSLVEHDPPQVVEAAAWEYIHKIDAMGGIVKAVEEGYPQREIARAAFEFQREVDSGRRSIVGVNKYVTPGEGDHIPTLKIEHEVERNQIERTKAFRAQRDKAVVERCLAAVKAALRDDKQNVMPPIFEAARTPQRTPRRPTRGSSRRTSPDSDPSRYGPVTAADRGPSP